jgi:glucokinase
MGLRGGIDLGGTKIQAVVVADGNDVLGQARLPTPKDGGPDGVIAAMAGAIRTAAQEAKVETSALAGVGIGSPGEVNPTAGTVTNAYNVVPDWNRTIEVGDILARDLGTRVGLGNDVRVATAAEFELGAGKPYRSLLGVFWGTGVGGGIILNGMPWTGRGAAGEIGHMVVRRKGARCTCGREGCMEAYSGRRAMELEARRRMKDGEKTHLFRTM